MFEYFDWNSQDTWPFDTADKIFLTRAVNRVGMHHYESEWPEAPVASAPPELPPNLESAYSFQIEAAAELLVPKPSRKFVTDALGKIDFRYVLNEVQWAAATQIRDIRAQRFETFRAVQLELREHCAKERLRSFAMDAHGAFESVPAGAWNTRQFETWFATGKLSRSDLIPALASSTSSEYWLYFSASDLDKLLSGERPIDRSPKVNLPTQALLEWANAIYASVASGQMPRPSQERFEELAREEFGPKLRIEQLRTEAWAKRPAHWPRKAPKGA